MIRTMTLAFAAAILTAFTPEIFAQAASPNAPDPTKGPATATGNSGVVAPAAPAVVPVVPAPGAIAPASAPRATSPKPRPSVAEGAVSDALFAVVAANSGMSELEISELGQQKAIDPELKRFSAKMVQDHVKLNEELTTLAAQKRLALPSQIDDCARFRWEGLYVLSGVEFDGCYAKAQVLAHMEAVAVFEAESKSGSDPELKAFATRALPILKKHLKTIKPIAMKYHEKEEGQTSAHAQDGSRQ